MDKKAHWEKIYSTKSHKEVSWFTEHVYSSLELIHKTGINKDEAIIDVGGGASTLADDLLNEGYRDITVFDISGSALAIAKERLKEKSSQVQWIEDDILNSDFGGKKYDLWHDRAVFHFLTSEEEREVYKEKVHRHLKQDGFLLISVFADDGPLKCSMLEIKRHSEKDVVDFFGNSFSKIFEERMVHITPSNIEQKFVNVILKKVKLN